MTSKDMLQKYLDEGRIKRLFIRVKTVLQEKGPAAHNWDHIFRDTINAILIGEAENADMKIVLPAIILHDIGFLYNSDPSCHHIIGADNCSEWLTEWDSIDGEKIAECIKSHKGKFPQFRVEPRSLEAKVVHDADLLEKFGNIGILQSLRTYVEFGLSGLDKYSIYRDLHSIVKMQSELKELTFYTKTGKRLADDKGGIDKRRSFFLDALTELKTYECE